MLHIQLPHRLVTCAPVRSPVFLHQVFDSQDVHTQQCSWHAWIIVHGFRVASRSWQIPGEGCELPASQKFVCKSTRHGPEVTPIAFAFCNMFVHARPVDTVCG